MSADDGRIALVESGSPKRSHVRLLRCSPESGELPGEDLDGIDVSSLVFLSDGVTLAYGTTAGEIAVQGGRRSSLPGSGSITAMAVNQDVLAVGTASGEVRLAELDGERPMSLELVPTPDKRSTAPGPVTALAFGGEGSELAVASGRRVDLWSVAKQRPEGVGFEGDSEITAMAYDQDTGLIAVGDARGHVRLWEKSGGTWWERLIWGTRRVDIPDPLSPSLAGHPRAVSAMRFASVEPLTLVSFSRDGTSIEWDLDVESWQRRACDLAGRNLRGSEWTKDELPGACEATCPDLESRCAEIGGIQSAMHRATEIDAVEQARGPRGDAFAANRPPRLREREEPQSEEVFDEPEA
jgi:WD40 repeat protein